MAGQERGESGLNAPLSIVDSQSSQLLAFALNKNPDIGSSNTQLDTVENTASQEQDTESPLSSMFVPPYQSYGLAHTQGRAESKENSTFDTGLVVNPNLKNGSKVQDTQTVTRVMGPPLLQKISLNQGTKQNTPQFSSKQDSFRTDFQNSTHGIAANELSDAPTDANNRIMFKTTHAETLKSSDHSTNDFREKSATISEGSSKYTFAPLSLIGENILVSGSDTSGPSQDSFTNSISGMETQIVGSTSGTSEMQTQIATQDSEQGNESEKRLHDTDDDQPELTDEIMSILSDPHSIYAMVPPEKRYKYYLNFLKNNDNVQSHATMAGTLIEREERKKSTILSPTVSDALGEIIQDSIVHETETESSPLRPVQSCDLDDIPPSESDSAERSREQDESQESDNIPLSRGLRLQLQSATKQLEPAAKSPKKMASKFPSTQSAKLVITNDSSKTRTPSGSNSPIHQANNIPKSSVGYEAPVTHLAEGDSESLHCDPVTPVPVPSFSSELVDDSSPAIPLAQYHSAKGQYPVVIPPQRTHLPLRSLQHVENSRLRMEDEETEIAGDSPLDEDFALTPEPHSDIEPESDHEPRSRKRKLGKVPKRAGKSKTSPTFRRVNGRGRTVTSQPPVKRIRTSPASRNAKVIARFGAGIGTQIFAPFKSDSFYYGAEVQQVLSDQRVHIKFFDDLEDTSSLIRNLRRFQLRVNDTITVEDGKRATVVDDSRWTTDNEVTAIYMDGDEEQSIIINAKDVRIPARSIQSQWKDRSLDPKEIMPAIQRRTIRETPSPSKLSSSSVLSSRLTRKPLSRYALIITLGPKNDNSWVVKKEMYQKMVRSSGGTLLNDWSDIYSMPGKYTYSNKRFIMTQDDFKYSLRDKNHNDTFDRVFLVSDIHNQKPKYLMALALGIPCISTDWLDALAEGKQESWSHHLLAAGYSEYLGASVSQLVDLNWGESVEHMTEIMENSVPLKLLAGKSVLCVGKETFPEPPKKNNKDNDLATKNEARRSIPRIMTAMGAERVEAVVNIEYASQRGLEHYDYIVAEAPIDSDPRYVDVNWIKQCLIAGRLLKMQI